MVRKTATNKQNLCRYQRFFFRFDRFHGHRCRPVALVARRYGSHLLVAHLSGAQESGNITALCFQCFYLCLLPSLPSFFGRGGSQTNKNTHLFFLRDSQNLIYQNCSNLPQINQILKGVPFGLNPAKIINYFLFNFIYLSLKGTLSLKGGIR